MGAGRSRLEEGEGNVFPEGPGSHGSDAPAVRGPEGSSVPQSLEELEITRLSRNRYPQEEDEAAIQLGLLPSHDWDDLETEIRETEVSRHPLEDGDQFPEGNDPRSSAWGPGYYPEDDEIELWHEIHMPDPSLERDAPSRSPEEDARFRRNRHSEWDVHTRNGEGIRQERSSGHPEIYQDDGSHQASHPYTSSRSIRQSTREQREYFIEKLLDAGVSDDGSILFGVRWKGYGPKDDTWEPQENLPKEMVRAARGRLHLTH